MMEDGLVIVVIPSRDLDEMGMSALANHKMEMTEPVFSKDGRMIGCWAQLIDETFLGEKEWFIPYESIFLIK